MLTQESMHRILEEAQHGLPLLNKEQIKVPMLKSILIFHLTELASQPNHKPLEFVFCKLLMVMAEDNGTVFVPTQSQFEASLEPIAEMLRRGYFTEPMSDINGSYWLMAAGETSEAEAFFSVSLNSYRELGNILESVFNNGL